MNTITIRLCPEAPEPLYEQIYKYIKQEITEGRYKPDLRLPSKRRLAAHLQCSQNTVQAAYNQLAAEGYISAKPRSGYYVCRLEGFFSIKNELSLKPDNSGSGFSYKYDFSHHGVDLDNFPFATWRKILKDVISEYDADLLKAGGTQGELNLRIAISEYLHNSRGVNCSPGQIIVSSGTEFLLLLLIQLFEDGSVFAIENPGYEKLNLIFKSNRAEYKAVDLDEAGMIPEKLIKSRADIACVTPSHQFPTGLIMPVSRRIQLLNWANEKTGRYIIEDDYDSEFKYGGRPVPSMQGLNGGGKVIYMGAFSKSLTPAIRISYMVLPEKLMELYREKLSFYICPVPAVEQKALYRFISGGYFERHLNRMRNIYKQKRETLIKALKNALPNSAVKGANAGLHLILTVDNGMSEEELILSARNNGVRVYGISQYYFGDAPKDGNTSLLLGFAALREKEIYEAAERLRKAWL